MRIRNITKEIDILRQVRDYLRWQGWYVYRNHQSLGSHKGLSDLTAVRNGVTAWIEIKKPGGRISDYQLKFREEIEAHGGKYLIVTKIEDLK